MSIRRMIAFLIIAPLWPIYALAAFVESGTEGVGVAFFCAKLTWRRIWEE